MSFKRSNKKSRGETGKGDRRELGRYETTVAVTASTRRRRGLPGPHKETHHRPLVVVPAISPVHLVQKGNSCVVYERTSRLTLATALGRSTSPSFSQHANPWFIRHGTNRNNRRGNDRSRIHFIFSTTNLLRGDQSGNFDRLNRPEIQNFIIEHNIQFSKI